MAEKRNGIDPKTNDESISGLLSDLEESCPDAEVLRILSGGSIHAYTARKLVRDVACAADAFVSMGFCRKTVALIGGNSYNWLTAYLAAICADAAVLCVDPSLSAAVIDRQMLDAEVRFVICDSESYKKINEHKFGNAVMLDTATGFTVKESVTNIIERGAKEDNAPSLPEYSRDEDLPAHIVFDSGAFGRDKAVVLSGKGLYAQVVSASDTLYCKRLLITEQFFNLRTLTSVIAFIALGKTLCMADDDLPLTDAAAILEPDAILLSPAGAREYYEGVWKTAFSEGFAKKLEKRVKRTIVLSKFGINVRRGNSAFLARQGLPPVKKLIVFGNNIDGETSYGLHMSGIDVICVYTVPECGVVSFTQKSDGKNSTLGKPCLDVFLKVNSLSQILVKADSAMIGYLGEGAYPDHWIPTGDTGTISGGRVVLQNDPQTLYVTSCAHRVFPQRIAETAKKQIPYAVSVNVTAGESGVSLFVAFDPGFLSLTSHSEIKSSVASSVNAVNDTLGAYEKITEVTIENFR